MRHPHARACRASLATEQALAGRGGRGVSCVLTAADAQAEAGPNHTGGGQGQQPAGLVADDICMLSVGKSCLGREFINPYVTATLRLKFHLLRGWSLLDTRGGSERRLNGSGLQNPWLQQPG